MTGQTGYGFSANTEIGLRHNEHRVPFPIRKEMTTGWAPIDLVSARSPFLFFLYCLPNTIPGAEPNLYFLN